eukprot:1157476-Pelagomonas_calceolata.AAC.1
MAVNMLLWPMVMLFKKTQVQPKGTETYLKPLDVMAGAGEAAAAASGTGSGGSGGGADTAKAGT